MAQVSIKVNGFIYNIGCEDGQEDHLQAMASQVDSRIDSIKELGGNSGESRLLLLASLLLADELHDLNREMESLRASGGCAGPRGEGEIGKRLGKLAARAEQIAAELDHP